MLRKTLICLLLLLFVTASAVVFADEIHDAAKNGDVAKLKALLSKNPALVNAKDKGLKGVTPLHWAAARNHKDAVKLLIQSKADVNAKDDNGNTPLHMAAREGNTDIVKMLIDAKAEISPKSKDGITPLHCAAAFGKMGATKALVEAKADLGAKDRWGMTPLAAATANKFMDVANFLKKSGAK